MYVWVCEIMLKSLKTEKKKERNVAGKKIITTFAAVIEFLIMTDKEFREYLRESMRVMDGKEMNLATMLEGQGAVLDTEFLDAYAAEVRYNMVVVRKCLAHYRGLMQKGGWLTKLILRRRVVWLNQRHRVLLGRLMLIGIYKRVNHPNPLLYQD